MISFALASRLKKAGFMPRTDGDARYFVSNEGTIRTEDAHRLWYDAKEGWERDFAELVYCPTLSELVEGCGFPFRLSCDATAVWVAESQGHKGTGRSPVEAVAALWLILHSRLQPDVAKTALIRVILGGRSE
jgi:hypothetical protein